MWPIHSFFGVDILFTITYHEMNKSSRQEWYNTIQDLLLIKEYREGMGCSVVFEMEHLARRERERE